MNEHWVVLRLLSPLRVGGVKPKNNYLATLPYIPGSVLRGSLAEWLKANGREGDILPIVSRLRFGNFFPASEGADFALPIPFTALECKLHGGFTSEGGHGVRDTLLVALVYGELEKLGARFPVPMMLRCTNNACKGRMERVGGFCAMVQGKWQKASVSLGVETKVALSRCRRVAQEGMMYRVFGIRPEEGLVFRGRLWGADEETLACLASAVEEVGIGALTTRGFGRATLLPGENRYPSLEERLQVFNERLQEVWQDLADFALGGKSRLPRNPQGTYFSIDLLSPGIFRDEYGLPVLVPSLTFRGGRIAPCFFVTQAALAGGWSTAWGLPKPTALAAAPGSVYVFRVEAPQREVVSFLEDLEAQGLGHRVSEGFGEITICHPLHREVMPV